MTLIRGADLAADPTSPRNSPTPRSRCSCWARTPHLWLGTKW